MNKIAHNNHIQSLRAIAVISVILFHTNSELFSTGYLGVDIFFVISGYLICGVMFKYEKIDKNSLFNFYIKRARRTLPALIGVIIFTIPFFLYVLMPVNLKDYGQSLIATPIFLSNLLFGSENNYWGAISELKPLLHTWSLSIEWQFYILFPLLFFFKYKFAIFLILFATSIISNIFVNFEEFQIFIGNHKVRIDNFFFTTNRIWEFTAGACLYVIEKDYKNKFDKNIFLSFLGLLIIFLSFYFFDRSAKENIYLNIIPVLGTCLFIFFTDNGKFNSIYKNKFLLHIGLISYSLYLWHQPILAFFKNIFNNNISIYYYLLIYFLIYISSLFSYHLIEKYFYEKKILKDKNFLVLAILFSSFIILVGWTISTGKFSVNNVINNKINNLEQKFPKIKVKELAQQRGILNQGRQEMFYKKFTESNKSKIFIFGDSHARDLLLTLIKSSKISEIYEFSLTDFENADAVLYSRQIYEDEIDKLENLKFIKKAKEEHKKIIIISRAAEFYSGNISPLIFNLTQNQRNIDAYSNLDKKFIDRNFYKILRDDVIKINIRLKEKTKKMGVLYLDRVKLACDMPKKNCHSMTTDGFALYWDHSHLTWAGVNFFSNLIDETDWFSPVKKFLIKE